MFKENNVWQLVTAGCLKEPLWTRMIRQPYNKEIFSYSLLTFFSKYFCYIRYS